MSPKPVIFTDLDGTLLDARTYTFVIGDRLDVIASGPTVPDSTTFGDAAEVIAKYRLADVLPPRVAAYLARGAAGREPETMKSDDPAFRKVRNVIVGSNRQALEAAREQARTLGYQPSVYSTELQGDAGRAGRALAERARLLQDNLSPGERLRLLAGGETTVTVTGTGKGGRNQEMALAFTRAISLAAQTFSENPLGTPLIPNRNRVTSAIPSILGMLLSAVDEDNR